MKKKIALRFGAFVLGLSVLIPLWVWSERGQAQVVPQDQRDYLYVLDTRGGFDASAILLVDAGSGSLLRTFPAALQPDESVSPDGNRLFVTSIDPKRNLRSFLKVYDTHSGATLAEVENLDDVQLVNPLYSGGRMTMSTSGKLIYMWKDRQFNSADHEYLAVFDTVNYRFLPYHIPLKDCFIRSVIPTMDDGIVDISCGQSLSEVVLDPFNTALNPEAANATVTHFPNNSEGLESNVIGGSLTSDGILRFVTRYGQAVAIDRRSQARTTQKLHGLEGLVLNKGTIVSPTSSVVHVLAGLGKPSGSFESDQLLEVDSKSMTVNASVKMPFPVLSLCSSLDGKSLYIISDKAATILVVDPQAMVVTAGFKSIGQTPVSAVAAPRF